MMKKLALISAVIFTILTFTGAAYVLLNSGRVNAGYAVVPMLFTIISLGFYRENNKK